MVSVTTNEHETVAELIEHLKLLPLDAVVEYCDIRFPGGSFAVPPHSEPMRHLIQGFNEYQAEASKTERFPATLPALAYITMGLAGEAGELANFSKKVFRDGSGVPTELQIKQLVAEGIDCVWYVSALCTELDRSFGEAARANLDKLASRAQRGVLHGSGDER